MKIHRIVFACIAIISLATLVHSGNGDSSSHLSTESAEAILGRWHLTLKAPDREYPSWLELREDNGQLKAEMVGR
ncbi:MAG TPA: hypothetical protein VIX91_26730 [Candidatus Acidoferrum sp.]